MTDTKTSGSCLCGEVSFKVSGPVKGITYCHCSLCRKQTGLYFASAGTLKENVLIAGEENITWYQDRQNANRGFCKNCGTILFWKSSREEFKNILAFTAGSIDNSPPLKGKMHIFCADKASFYALNDDLPKHDGDISA